MKRRLAWVSVLVMLAACADLAGPDRPDPWPDFTAWLVRPGSDPVPELGASSVGGVLVVQGALGTPYPCYDVRGYVRRDGTRIDLTVEARRQDVICVAVVAAFGYRAGVRLPPGSYHVRVTHAVDGRPAQVLDTTVAVE